ncbi:hypothetical protein V6N13_103746 [Hibiscus sabdariffa]|uniref:KIB1-4 beta-propeller domain-containing protein n=2 Tax=Hibiscus sabdariffa TaxID=183260 RepID=A0ABR2BSP4_9ROSI
MPCTIRFIGSSSGWLVTVDDVSAIRLLNPLYLFLGEQICRNPNACITLPPLEAAVFFWDGVQMDNNHHIHKAVLSANPASKPDEYMVIAIVGDRDVELAFNRPSRGNEWTTFYRHYCSFEDVIYFRDCIYAVDRIGSVVYSKVIDNEPRAEYKFLHNSGEPILSKKHLLESTAGELLLD